MICRARSWIAAPSSLCGRPRCRPSFTLIEMVVVLLIMAMLAGAAVLSLRRPLQTARINRVLSSIEDADRRARLKARRSSQTVELSIDGGKNVATVSTVANYQLRSTNIQSRHSLPFSGGLHIDRFVSVNGVTTDEQMTVRYGPNGQTETYAVRLDTDRDDRQSKTTWLVVVGATGQYIRSNEESVVEAIVSKKR